MFIIYIKKKHLIWLAAAIIIIISFLLFINSYFQCRDVPTLSPIYIGNTGEKAVALMVNVDWGEDLIPDMLKILEQKKVKVTFFITGKFTKSFPDLVKQIASQGHEIGNHGYSHPHADSLSIEENKKEISSTEEIFSGLNIKFNHIFAPPYGEHKPQVVQAATSLGYKTIMWTVDTIDWQDPSPQVIMERITSKADNGSLILMHPKKCTLTALPSIIDILQSQQFQLKTVSEIIQ